MKKLLSLLILSLLFFAFFGGNVSGQCTVGAGADESICQEGTTAPLGGTITDGTPLWTSSAGGTFAPDATTLNATWTSPVGFTGTSILTLTATGGTCLSNSDTKTVTINAILPVSVTTAADANPVCAGIPVTFTATSVNEGLSPVYQWYNGSSPIGSNSSTFTYTPLHGDVISVVLTSSETCKSGSPATSNTVTMTVNDILPVSVTIAASANPVCAGTPVTFTATPVNGGLLPVYQWYNGSSPVGTNSSTFTYTPSNGDAISVVLTSGESCKSGSPATSNTLTLTVNAYPSISNMAITTGSDTPFSATPVDVTNGTVPSGTLYSWSSPFSESGITGGAAGSNELNISGTLHNSKNVSKTATYTVTPKNLTCTGSDFSLTVTVNAKPSVSNKSVTICSGSTFTIVPVDGVDGDVVPSGTIYTWPAPLVPSEVTGRASGTDAISISGTLTNNSGTVQTVIYTVTPKDGSETGSNFTLTVTVNPIPSPTITGTTPICVLSTETYLTQPGKTLYVWAFTGGSKVSGGGSSDNSITINWTTPGTNNVNVIYTDLGCTASAPYVHNVTVDPKPVPGAITITGNLKQFMTLTSSYDYINGICPAEVLSGTKVSWWRAADALGSSPEFISTKPGSDRTHVLSAADVGKYMQVRIEAFDGTTLSAPQSSTSWIGPVEANEVPVASALSITGTPSVGNELTAHYTYTDAESDPQGASLFKWYRDGTIITGANSDKYTIVKADRGKSIKFSITPAASSGSTPGALITSAVVGPVGDQAPVADNVVISGTPKVGQVLVGSYQYSDNEGDAEQGSTYQWYTGNNASGAGSAIITGANSISYLLTNNEKDKFIGFSVVPRTLYGTSPGSIVTTPVWSGPVTNDAPVATILPVTGSLNVNGIITGHYVYSDAEGDPESGSAYQWYSSNSAAGPYSIILGETGISHSINISEQKKYFQFHVIPKALTGTMSGSEKISAEYGPVNSKPYVDNVQITGTTSVGAELTASCIYHDVDGDLSDHYNYRWLRAGSPIAGAIGDKYTITYDDEGYALTVEITPVAKTGYPDTGSPVISSPTAIITDPSILKPVATDVCIEGTRIIGFPLRGKYYYDYHRPEKNSIYQWLRNGSPIAGANNLEYVVTSADMNSEISFSVTPVSSNNPSRAGEPVVTENFARIIDLKDTYSVIEPPVALNATPVKTGLFSGPGVTFDKMFSPEEAGDGTNLIINYFLEVTTSKYLCPQRTIATLTVKRNEAYFDTTLFYCQSELPDEIIVKNIPAGATDFNIKFTDGDAEIGRTATSIVIDPRKMRSGLGRDSLYFYYKLAGVPYRIGDGFTIDSVGQEIKILNLKNAYCDGDAKEYITVEGIYPLGGNAFWTGAILSETKIAAAYADPELGTPGNKYTITYNYQSPGGCTSSIIKKDVTINELPKAHFSLNPTQNIEGVPVDLVPLQTGGLFSGDGVSGNTLFPAIAGLGPHTLNYYIKDGNGCDSTLNLNTTVRQALATFEDIPSTICYADITYHVRVTNLPTGLSSSDFSITGFTNFKNTLIYTPGSTTADYSVVAAGAGEDTLVFSYKWYGVDFSIKRPLFIDKLDQVTIGGITSGQLICAHEGKIELFPSIPDGVFTGPVTGGFLDPVKRTEGISDYTVSYKYTNIKTGCSTSTSVPVKLYPSPDVSFLPVDVCISNDSDTTLFINRTTSTDAIKLWQWEFDAGLFKTSPRKDAGNLYKSGGLQKISLTATTLNGCKVTKESTFNLVRRPDADFYWLNDCMQPGGYIKLVDSTTSTVPVDSRGWRLFGTSDFFNTTKVALYPKVDTGYIHIEYIVRADYETCNDTVVKDIYIRPAITVPSDGYFQNFESGTNRWIRGDNSTIWSFGIPGGANSASWFTGNPKDGTASVESPCFDFTRIERPVIKLGVMKDFEKDRDGAALQYKLSNSADWLYVGTIDDGIEWYNSASIRGEPGGNQLGWTTVGTSDIEYVDATHSLDELIGKKDVKFRIVYGSSGAYTSHNGFSFDNIWIGERSRHVLMEHFTNMSDPASMNANILVNTIANHKEGDVINIQYHTNFPGHDDFYNFNPRDVSARLLYYGLTKVPYTFIDGGTNRNYAMIFDNVIGKIDSNIVTKRSLNNSPFRIGINSIITNNRFLTVKGYIKAVEDPGPTLKNLTLFIAVTEKKKDLNNKIFQNVFRKFLPDAGGIILKDAFGIKTTWQASDSIPIPETSWLIDTTLNVADIEIIAFLQDPSGKEVFQAISADPDLVVGIKKNADQETSGFSIYPNPASDRITIDFGEPLKTDVEIMLYDIRGEMIRTYKAGAGLNEFIIEDPGLRGGIYLVRLVRGKFNSGYKKLIVTGD